MRSDSLAQALLTLCTDRETAASITGDFLEEADRHGRGWFWRQTVRTLLRMSVQQLVAAPVRSLALVLLGLALGHLTLNILTPRLLISFGFFPIRSNTIWIEGIGLVISFGYVPTRSDTIWAVGMIIWLRIAAPFLVGIVIAALSRGRELAVCGALALTDQVILFGAFLYYSDFLHRATNVPSFASLTLLIAISTLFAGILVRRFRLGQPSRS